MTSSTLDFTAATRELPAEVSERPRRRTVVIIITVLVLVALLDQCRHCLAPLLRQDVYHFDACQHVWWTYRYRDPQLFPNDPIAQYMSQPVFGTYGYKA